MGSLGRHLVLLRRVVDVSCRRHLSDARVRARDGRIDRLTRLVDIGGMPSSSDRQALGSQQGSLGLESVPQWAVHMAAGFADRLAGTRDRLLYSMGTGSWLMTRSGTRSTCQDDIPYVTH